jgi:hypothetical protein
MTLGSDAVCCIGNACKREATLTENLRKTKFMGSQPFDGLLQCTPVWLHGLEDLSNGPHVNMLLGIDSTSARILFPCSIYRA